MLHDLLLLLLQMPAELLCARANALRTFALRRVLLLLHAKHQLRTTCHP